MDISRLLNPVASSPLSWQAIPRTSFGNSSTTLLSRGSLVSCASLEAIDCVRAKCIAHRTTFDKLLGGYEEERRLYLEVVWWLDQLLADGPEHDCSSLLDELYDDESRLNRFLSNCDRLGEGGLSLYSPTVPKELFTSDLATTQAERRAQFQKSIDLVSKELNKIRSIGRIDDLLDSMKELESLTPSSETDQCWYQLEHQMAALSKQVDKFYRAHELGSWDRRVIASMRETSEVSYHWVQRHKERLDRWKQLRNILIGVKEAAFKVGCDRVMLRRDPLVKGLLNGLCVDRILTQDEIVNYFLCWDEGMRKELPLTWEAEVGRFFGHPNLLTAQMCKEITYNA